MRLFIHSNSCEYSCCACSGREIFDSTTDDVYSIDVPDFIKINTLVHIIKDKEHMTDHNFQAMRLLCNGKIIYPGPMTPIQFPSMCDQPRSRPVVEQLWEDLRGSGDGIQAETLGSPAFQMADHATYTDGNRAIRITDGTVTDLSWDEGEYLGLSVTIKARGDSSVSFYLKHA